MVEHPRNLLESVATFTTWMAVALAMLLAVMV